MVPDPTPLFPSLCILDEDEEASVAMGEEDEVSEFDGCTTSIVRMSFIVSRYSYARARWRMEVDGRSMLDGISYHDVIIHGACAMCMSAFNMQQAQHHAALRELGRNDFRFQ